MNIELSKYESKMIISALEEYTRHKLEIASKNNNPASKEFQTGLAKDAKDLSKRVINLLNE